MQPPQEFEVAVQGRTKGDAIGGLVAPVTHRRSMPPVCHDGVTLNGMSPTRPVVSHFLLFALASLATRALSFAIPVIDMDETAHAVGSWVA